MVGWWSVWFRSRSATGSTPSSYASSSIADSSANSPTPSAGARIGVGRIVATGATRCVVTMAGAAYSACVPSPAFSRCSA